eukprot:jgi/Bigna1/80995/fgenesh1_pg.76_\
MAGTAFYLPRRSMHCTRPPSVEGPKGPEVSYSNAMGAPPGASVFVKENFQVEGGTLSKMQIVYETWGRLSRKKDNAVLLHCGPGLALDTDLFFVICVNNLGSCYGSTGPSSIDPNKSSNNNNNIPYGSSFPTFSVQRIKMMIMVSIRICGFFTRSRMCAAWASVCARSVVLYAVKAQGIATTLIGENFEIERYIRYQGSKWSAAGVFDPNSVIWISTAMDAFTLEKEDENGELSMIEGVKSIQMPALIIGVQTDVLFPSWQQKQVADLLRAAGNKSVTYYELDSLYGHDTFLLDKVSIGGAVKGHLEQEPNGANHILRDAACVSLTRYYCYKMDWDDDRLACKAGVRTKWKIYIEWLLRLGASLMLRTLQTQDFSRDTMDEVFHRLDTDHDGFVDFDEVVALIFLVQQSRIYGRALPSLKPKDNQFAKK